MFLSEKTKKLSGPQRVLEAAFIFVIILSVFIVVSLLSHDSSDPSLSQTSLTGEVQNLMGQFGASVSDTLLSILGYASIIVPFTLLYLGFCFFIKKIELIKLDFFTIGIRIIGYVFIVLSLLVLISMNVVNGEFESGGIIGSVLSSVSTIYFNDLGTTLLFLCLFVCGIPMFTGVSWLTISDFIGEWIFNLIFFKDYLDRKKAIEQLRSMAKGNLDSDNFEHEENPLETTIDPETGFSIYLREESELIYSSSTASSSYDEDNQPPIINKVKERPANNFDKIFDKDIDELDSSSSKSVHKEQSNSSYDFTQNEVKNSQVQSKLETNAIQLPTQDASSKTISIAESEPLVTSSVSKNVENQNNQQNATTQANMKKDDPYLFTIDDDDYHGSPSEKNTPQQNTASNNSQITSSNINQNVEDNFISFPFGQEINTFSSAEQEDADDVSLDDVTSADVSTISPLKTENGFNSNENLATSSSPNNNLDDNFFDFDNDLSTNGNSNVDVNKINEPTSNIVEQSKEVDNLSLSNAPWNQDQGSDTSSTSANNNLWDDDDDFLMPNSHRHRKGESYDPNALPSVDLLNVVPPKPNVVPKEQLEALGRLIEQKLAEFRIQAAVVDYEPGPVITRFSLQLSPGTKVSTISKLSRDLARELAAKAVRVVDIIPGTTYVGLELPNTHRQTVYFKELIDSEEFSNSNAKLTCALGCDIVGKPIVMNLAKMPHLLVAGTTGSGKSVGVNGMILSMLYKCTPDDLRLIMIDPKMLEFSSYNNIPHLLTEVVTDMKDASNALRWCVGEMERRYKLMMKLGVKKIDEYNDKIKRSEEINAPILDPLWEPTEQLSDERPYLKKLPYIVVVIDELADMMMQVGKKVEELIARLAQKARAAGIHMIIATQSPRADVLTGLIKSNVPSRLAFTVANGIESKIILEQQGAESLLGNGDMLFNPTGSNAPNRVHGAYVTPDEIDRIVAFWRSQGEPEYVDTIFDDELTDENTLPSEKAEFENSVKNGGYDNLLNDAIKLIVEQDKASTSVLQRRMGIGYPRAAKIIDQLEDIGLISKPLNSAGKRSVFKDKCSAFLESNGVDTGAINTFGDDQY